MLNFGTKTPGSFKRLCLQSVAGLALFLLIYFGMDRPYWEIQRAGYRTVFIIYDGFLRQLAFAFLYIAIGSVLFIASLLVVLKRKLPKWWWPTQAGKPAFVLAFSVLWLVVSVGAFSVNLWEAWQYLSTYRNGKSGVVEGVVHVLHEQPAAGHADPDVIVVGGVRLTIDYFGRIPAYRRTIAHGGALRDGIRARLYFCGAKILRVDLPQALPTPVSSSQPRP